MTVTIPYQLLARAGDSGPYASALLVSVEEAVEWVAFKAHRRADALVPRHWSSRIGPDWSEMEADDARRDLAEEVVIAAILRGDVRCVQVLPEVLAPAGPVCLWAVDPALFLSEEVALDHGENGLEFHVTTPTGTVLIEEVLLLWAEVEQLRSPMTLKDRRAKQLLEAPIPFGEPPRLVTLDGEQFDRPQPAVSTPNPQERAKTGDRRHDRTPEAALTLELSVLSDERLAALSAKQLGGMLANHFVKADLRAPYHGDANKQASTIRKAIQASRADET